MGGDDGHAKAKPNKCNSIKNFLYDSETGAVLGRTGSSWAKILLFYAVYYAGLAAFFAICLIGFFSTLDDRIPTQIHMHTPLKLSPGMGFRPKLTVESSLIQFDESKPASYIKLVDDLTKFLEPYHKPAAEGAIDCTSNPNRTLGLNEVCTFPIELLGTQCTEANGYGYKNGTPCILLKMNRIYDWTPQNMDPEPTSAPEVSGNSATTHSPPDHKAHMDNYVGVKCTGQHDADVDAIKSVKYFPEHGFPFSYYPYLTQAGYVAPLVMAQFEVTRGGIIVVECQVLAKNIRHHRVDRQGGVVFELVVDSPKR